VTDLPLGRPARVAFIGLGKIFDLDHRGYVDNPDCEVVALVDPREEARALRAAIFPQARLCASLQELLEDPPDLAVVLVPPRLHAEVVVELLEAGVHVTLQKPFCVTMQEAARMTAARDASGKVLRLQENYIFYEPLRTMRSLVREGAIGDVVGFHMKMVGTGLGGWDVPWQSYVWQFEQAKAGRGILVYDDGWHKFAVARWLFGDVEEVMAWIGNTELGGGFGMDAPTTIMWRHTNGVRGVWDITAAPQMYLRSDYYTNDERFEVTGQLGYARVNRCTGRGIQQPSLEVYRDGEVRAFHALDDDWGSSFKRGGTELLAWLVHGTPGPDGDPATGMPHWSAEDATQVLRFVEAAYASSEANAPVRL
jgi:predicted dehydrogenase